MNVELVKLAGEFVKLEPLSLERHFTELCSVAFDADLWQWTVNQIENAADLERYLAKAIDEQRRGVSLPFATIEQQTGKAIGSTRFGSISLENRRVEIGWTWIGKEWQRTAVNTEAKLLMLTHAFETWHVNRVELKTDFLNVRSRRAIARLGATEEGVLRKHMITDSGRIRDTVYFGITNDEWQRVKTNLKNKLVKP